MPIHPGFFNGPSDPALDAALVDLSQMLLDSNEFLYIN
jgi:hypothetical protein